MKNPRSVLSDLKHRIDLFYPLDSDKLRHTKLIVAMKEKRNAQTGRRKEEYQQLINELESQTIL